MFTSSTIETACAPLSLEQRFEVFGKCEQQLGPPPEAPSKAWIDCIVAGCKSGPAATSSEPSISRQMTKISSMDVYKMSPVRSSQLTRVAPSLPRAVTRNEGFDWEKHKWTLAGVGLILAGGLVYTVVRAKAMAR